MTFKTWLFDRDRKTSALRVGIRWYRSETAECVITSGRNVAAHLNGLSRGLENEDADALLIAILVRDNERTGKARGYKEEQKSIQSHFSTSFYFLLFFFECLFIQEI